MLLSIKDGEGFSTRIIFMKRNISHTRVSLYQSCTGVTLREFKEEGGICYCLVTRSFPRSCG